jgi:predicted permease
MIRRLLRTPGFTALTLLTLAIGIGANTAIFSVINGVLLKPLPFANAERLAALRLNVLGPGWQDAGVSSALYYLLREESKSLDDVALWRSDRLLVNGLGEPDQVEALDITPSFLRALEVNPIAGRAFTEEDGDPARPLTAMITYPYLWSRFGGVPSDAIGKSILLDSEAYEIIGVLPPSFRFLNAKPMLVVTFRFERSKARVDQWFYQGLARLKPGISWEQANAEAAQLLPRLIDEFPTSPDFNREKFEQARFVPSFRPLKREAVGDVGLVLWLLMGTVGVVLLIACANVANLLLVRAEGRQQELAIRAALGASRADLAWNLLAESIVLSLFGGALALGVAFGATKLLIVLAPPGLPRLSEITMSPTVFAFSFGVSLLGGVLFGLAPVWRYAGPRLGSILRSGGRTASGSRERHRARSALIVAQVALATLLLVSAGLMIRTFAALIRVEPGFRQPEQVLTASLALPTAQIKSNDRVIAIYQEMVKKVRAIPGVLSASVGWGITLDGSEGGTWLYLEDHVYKDGELPPDRRYKVAGPDMFSTMGNPLIAGREFTWTDMEKRTPCAIVSASLAREFWGDAPRAIGKRIRESPASPWREIVGVVGDEHDDGLNKPGARTIHWPLAMGGYRGVRDEVRRFSRIIVRSPRTGQPGFLDEIKAAIWAVEPTTPVAYVRTLKQIQDESMARTTFTLVMLAIAAWMALILVVSGVYGVVSYSVSQRIREIGIRTALGASSRDVRGMIFGQALVLAALGVLIGLAASTALTRSMSTLLYGVSRNDLTTLAAVPLVLAATVLLASYVPVRRALRIQPVEALRVE